MKHLEEQKDKWMQYHMDSAACEEMPPLIRSAWNNAKKNDVDPYIEKIPKITYNEKQEAKLRNKYLFVYTQSILNVFVRRAAEVNSNYAVLLFDTNGILIKIYANGAAKQWLLQRGIEEWSVWEEESIGPNPFSIGMENRKGICIKGYENYAQMFLGTDWFFAPIHKGEDIKGGMVICSSIGGLANTKTDFLIALCKNVEMHYFWFDTFQKTIEATEGVGVMSFDLSLNESKIIVMSKQMFQMLTIPEQECFYLQADKIIDPPPRNKEFWKILKERKIVSDYNIQLSCQNRRVSVCISTSLFCHDDFHIDGLTVIFSSYNRMQKLVSQYATGGTAKHTFDTIVGNSPAYISVLDLCHNASKHEGNVLLLGESGSGKDVLAQAIHNGSDRRGGPFIALNCAAFSKELIASELFGYEEGAFTGARKGGSVGKIELANHGTLFLDEIGDMPMELQAILLRVIEERCFTKIGGNKLIHVDVRIIAATNQNLTEAIRENRFRSDLFYRLSVVRIKVPPLRERREDIMILADYFIGNICARYGRRKITFTEEAEQCMLNYSWPGNVRELQNLLEGIICTCQSELVDVDMIKMYLMEEPKNVHQEQIIVTGVDDECRQMQAVMKKCRGNRTKAAELMNMSRSTFYRRLKEYGLDT